MSINDVEFAGHFMALPGRWSVGGRCQEGCDRSLSLTNIRELGAEMLHTLAVVTTDQVPFSLDDPPLDDPPEDPPEGCNDLVVWALAREYYAEHQPDESRYCPSCDGPSPCGGQLLARHGLAAAFGVETPMAEYWRGKAKIHDHEAHR